MRGKVQKSFASAFHNDSSMLYQDSNAKSLMSRIMSVWKICYQLLSRSKQLIAKQDTWIVNKLLFAWIVQQRCSAARNKLRLDTLSMWHSAKQSSMMQFGKKMHSNHCILSRRLSSHGFANVEQQIRYYRTKNWIYKQYFDHFKFWKQLHTGLRFARKQSGLLRHGQYNQRVKWMKSLALTVKLWENRTETSWICLKM